MQTEHLLYLRREGHVGLWIFGRRCPARRYKPSVERSQRVGMRSPLLEFGRRQYPTRVGPSCGLMDAASPSGDLGSRFRHDAEIDAASEAVSTGFAARGVNCASRRLIQRGPRQRHFRHGAICGAPRDCGDKCSACRLAAQFEIVERGAQFEQRRALAAGQLGRRGEPCCPRIRIDVRVGANPP